MAAPPWLWPVLIAAGVLVRLCIWWVSIGSNDVYGWATHGHNVHTLGLAETYRTAPDYNHPPLMGLYASWAWTRSGESLAIFARWIKLPGLLGEALALIALGRLGGRRLAGLYALMPAPILVSAYHGNTDCLYAALSLLAALAWERRRWAFAGLALAAALQVKLIPLVLVPLFVVASPSPGALLRFALALGAGLLPFVPPALEVGAAMHRNMVAYNSSGDEWGFLALLNEAERCMALQSVATPLREAFIVAGRWLIMGGVVLLALASRLFLRLPMRVQVALAGALFLTFAPGFGVQYVVFVAPALMAVHAGAGTFWGIASGLFVGALYAVYLKPGPVWYSVFSSPFPGWIPEIGVVAWAGLWTWAALCLRDAWRAARAQARPEPERVAAR